MQPCALTQFHGFPLVVAIVYPTSEVGTPMRRDYVAR